MRGANGLVGVPAEGVICEMWPEMVRPAGFEPAPFGSGDLCAIQVSYFALLLPSA